jgi:hypothetical protein
MSLASLRLHAAKEARAACLLRLGYGAPGEVFDDFGGDDIGIGAFVLRHFRFQAFPHFSFQRFSF